MKEFRSYHCCCGQQLKHGWECRCEWSGWIDLRKDETLPEKDGIYKVRYHTNDANAGEGLMRYTKVPVRFEEPPGSDEKYPIHWDRSHHDDNIVYAWQYLI